ncbi:MAG: hydrogen peroxide-inducible genes activator [Rhizobiales bacterium]|nr:hydrogen peroxide-inducible genes activator [Hyphomicrobiales bacterium]
MVVTQSQVASEVGAQILREGGNAIDSAVAVGFALAVTLPRAGNLGGSGFMLIHLAAEKRTIAVEFYSQAPANIRPEVLLTPEGQEIAKRARDILMAVQDLTELGSHRHHPLSGRLRLGVIPSIGPYFLPKLLPDVHRTFPDLVISLRESQTHVLVNDLLDGSLDLLILALPVEPDEIATMTLFDDPFSVALPRQHALAAATEVTQEQLADQHLLLLEEGHCLRDQALAVCQTAQTDEFRASSLATVVQMVANGYGITILPALAIPTEVGDPGPIAVVPFAKPVPFRTIGLAWRRSSPHQEAFRELGRFIQNRFSPSRI